MFLVSAGLTSILSPDVSDLLGSHQASFYGMVITSLFIPNKAEAIFVIVIIMWAPEIVDSSLSWYGGHIKIAKICCQKAVAGRIGTEPCNVIKIGTEIQGCTLVQARMQYCVRMALLPLLLQRLPEARRYRFHLFAFSSIVFGRVLHCGVSANYFPLKISLLCIAFCGFPPLLS